MPEKNYKFVVLEHTAKETQDIFKYQEDDEEVEGFVCFEKFSDAKYLYLECLQEKVNTALNLKQKDI